MHVNNGGTTTTSIQEPTNTVHTRPAPVLVRITAAASRCRREILRSRA